MSAVLTPSRGLRHMKEGDLKVVVAMEASAYPFPWSYGIFRDCLQVGYCCWVYEENGEIIAYVVMSIGADEAHILTLVVQEDYRNQGIGNMFMQHMLSIARQHRVQSMLLEVRPSNVGAINLYLKLGFNELGVRPNYYPAKNGREDAIIMAMEFSQRKFS